jgi:predicted transcriptional regulator
VRQLRQDGCFVSRDAAQGLADLLGVSRATVHNYARCHHSTLLLLDQTIGRIAAVLKKMDISL